MADGIATSWRLTTPEGLAIVGDEAGDPAARPVLFLHGGGQTRNSWRGIMARTAAAGHRAVCYDARGHGESDWAADGAYALADFGRDLECVIDRLDADPIVVGASLGGVTALQQFGESALPRAQGVALIDIAPRPSPQAIARILGFMNAYPDGFASIDEAAEAVSAFNPDRPRPRSSAGLARNLRRRGDRWVWHWDPAFVADRDQAIMNRADRLDAAARGLRLPALLVHAASSDVVSEEELRRFQRLIPDADYVNVAGAGHMIVGQGNDAFESAILGFVERIARRGS